MPVASTKNPYASPQSVECGELRHEIAALDAVLGPGLDARSSATPDGRAVFFDRAARNAASGWLPSRGVVRRMPGADRKARDMARAALAGSVRRGYPKGMSHPAYCPP